MSLTSALKSIFAGRNPAEQLAQAEAAIITSEKLLDTLRGQRPELVRQKMLGDTAATAQLDDLDRAIEAEERRLRDWRDAAAATRSEMMRTAAAARRAEVDARPKQIAELVRERLRLASETTTAMEVVARSTQAFSDNATALASLLNLTTVNTFFSAGAFRSRLQAASARVFAIDPNGPLTVANSLLGIASNQVGAATRRTLLDHEQLGLDDLAPFFLSLQEAEAARDRLKVRGSETMVVELNAKVWTLVRSERVFGRREAAEAAARRDPGLAIVGAEGGFLLLDRRFVGEAA